jgi:hypothetical protein
MSIGLSRRVTHVFSGSRMQGGIDVAFALHGSTVKTRCNHVRENKLWGAS